MSNLKVMESYPMSDHHLLSVEEMKKRANDFSIEMSNFCSVKKISDRPFPPEILEDCLRAATLAPNETSSEPWHYVVISDASLKKEIRIQSEKWENTTYINPDAFGVFQQVSHLSVDHYKPHLDSAPYFIAVFVRTHEITARGIHTRNYFAKEAVGMSVGILLAAIRRSGLDALVLAPGPARFLNEILQRPDNEQPYLLLAVGYPDKESKTEKTAKDLSEFTTFL